MAILGFILIMAYGIAQFVAGYIGIEEHFGAVWAGAALFGAFMFRFMLPITIGGFFGATDVWGWHWSLALVFVAPGLLFMIPGMLAMITAWFKNQRSEYP